MSKRQERKDLVKGRPGTAIKVFNTWERKIREPIANAPSPSKITWCEPRKSEFITVTAKKKIGMGRKEGSHWNRKWGRISKNCKKARRC